MMITETDLLAVVDAYAGATGASDTTISSRVFADTKKLDAMRHGASITLRRANDAIKWFSDNWPDGAVWPPQINRPAELPTEAPS
ncbi:hypothetical protein [Methylocystis sp.]|uniref:hypothetical protein n=1 Tax=Methylocystis sp. TaxID=1911079 RepID=UPI003D0C11A1